MSEATYDVKMIQEFIKANFDLMSFKEMSEIIDVPAGTISYHAHTLGLNKRKTLDIDGYIRNRFYHDSVTNIAQDLGVSRGTVQRHAIAMGLRKHGEYVRQPFEIEVDVDELLPGCFVTSHGRIVRRSNNRVITPRKSGAYHKVTVEIDGVIYEKRWHQLIAYAFVPNPHNKPIINHMDGNSYNNNIFNLEWCTVQENAIHAVQWGLQKSGEDAPAAKITEDQALQIIDCINAGMKRGEILDKLPFATKSIVDKIRNKSRWKHLSHLIK